MKIYNLRNDMLQNSQQANSKTTIKNTEYYHITRHRSVTTKENAMSLI